jgi:RNA polymerase sigma-70 factor, ECF subfamily
LVVQTFTVAHSWLECSAALIAALIWDGDGPDAIAELGDASANAPPTARSAILALTWRKIARVMDRLGVRSEGVTAVLEEQPSPSTWERFEVLYRSSRDDVYAYVATLLRDPAAAEDVTALAFERAYRRRRTFDRRRGEERAWLFGIARNAALDELRRRRRLAALTGDPIDDASPDDLVDVALRRTAVRAALAKLSGRERELVALKFHAGLTNGEIARVLGASESGVGTRLHRVMEKLREACDET